MRKIILTLVLLISGLSGISYEILYGRILGAILGDQFAVSAAVLITFLMGIGVGARHAHRVWHRLWLVEALIGVYGIAFALSADTLEHWLYFGMDFLPGLAGPILLGTLLLLLPALLLGCSVPLFAGYLGRMNDGPIFSRVYAIYNLGAAVTALLIEFWLIRQFGVTGTVIAFGMTNLVAAGLLFVTAKPIAAIPPPVAATLTLPRHHLIALILASMASAVFQLLMVKLSEMMFGPFRESFALVLSIILFGIALGSWLVRQFNIGFDKLMLVNLIGLGWLLVVYQDVLFVYASLYETAVAHREAIVLLKGGVLALLMGLPAVTFGATIPALLNARNEVAKESGHLLFMGSLANVAGFLLMALVLHRYLDYGVLLLVIAALVTAALLVFRWDSLRHCRRQTQWHGYPVPLAATLVLLATAGWQHWKWDEDLLYLSHTSFHSAKTMEDDRKAFDFPEKFKGLQDVFAITWSDGDPYFFINGFISIPLNSPSEKVVGTLGSMFSPKTGQALVLGLGSGATASAVGLLFDHTDVIEINPVVRDNQFRMKQWNFDIESNPRVNIVVDDGIHYIQSVDQRYDMILNTVTSPLYFSSSKLYTLNFFEKVKRRLNPDGIYLTWMDSRVGTEGAQIILNTLKQRFKHCSILFVKAGYYLLIASDQPVRLQHPNVTDRAPMLRDDLLQKKIIPRLLAYNVLSSELFTQAMAFDAPVNTIDRPMLEFSMAGMKKKEFKDFQQQLYGALSLEDVARSIEPAMPYDPIEHLAHLKMAQRRSPIALTFEQLGQTYVRDMERRVNKATLTIYETVASSVNTAVAHYELGNEYRLRDRFEDALAEYEKVLQLDPTHPNVLFNMAACQEYQGRHAQALDLYTQARKLNPSDVDVSYRLARVNLNLDNLDEALVHINQALAQQPTKNTFVLKAEILRALGRDDQVLSTFLEMLKLYPDDREAQREINKSMAKW